MPLLLDRAAFRAAVFDRDRSKCVICGSSEKIDAHHILERRLWDDGGYYLDNGATLCGEGCHRAAEMTILPCEEIRLAARIERIVLPPHLYEDYRYDKWSNILLPNGTRIKGELFGDESVRKILEAGGVLASFGDLVKYPRTHHLPWSLAIASDDRTLSSTAIFAGREVVATEKMDGENTSMYRGAIHARSLDSGSHPSRSWIKNLHGKIKGSIPEGWRICGENLLARHSLAYEDLSSYFMVFSIWDESNECLSWDDTNEYAAILDLDVVPVLWRGIWDEDEVRDIEKKIDFSRTEGYVCRLSGAFSYAAFRKSVAKFVRADHVASHNWMMRPIVKNKLRSSR